MNPLIFALIRYGPLFPFVELSGVFPAYEIIKQRDASNVEPMPFIAMIINYILWTYYGHLVHDIILCIGNIAGIVCGAGYFVVFCQFATSSSCQYYINILKGSMIALCSLLILPSIVHLSGDRRHAEFVGIMGCLAATFLMASPLCTLNRVLSEQSTQSMSLVVSIAMTVNGLSWTAYGYFIQQGDLFIIVPNGAGCFAGCIQLFLFYLFPENPLHDERSIHSENLVRSQEQEQQPLLLEPQQKDCKTFHSD